ncbi:hypothetical protein ANN_04066 [Periplaneta americana]|uniref:Uncharacterized protein n=1 Tax=Periplaneta americana TaxID=6978 RepID=A0ABQ8T7J5_PERAM|nr:hypothetical protein ANN_04066 [Periplaneta americana]
MRNAVYRLVKSKVIKHSFDNLITVGKVWLKFFLDRHRSKISLRRYTDKNVAYCDPIRYNELNLYSNFHRNPFSHYREKVQRSARVSTCIRAFAKSRWTRQRANVNFWEIGKITHGMLKQAYGDEAADRLLKYTLLTAGSCSFSHYRPHSVYNDTWRKVVPCCIEAGHKGNGFPFSERTLDSSRCRRCDEQETLPHVLGFCHHGELLRINRHNTVRSLIASSIRQNSSYEVYEEVGCISSDGSTRRADIIIIDRQKDKGVILDPTIRFEMQEQQPQEVVVITEDVQNVHLLLEYRPHIDVSLTCEHDPKLQEYCVCPQNMPQFDSEGIPNQAPETNKPMILNGPTSRNREGSDQVSVEEKQLGHLYLSID